ncbi:hypothetical protein [Aestuariivirga sp.]|uniref:hypothetical protein n=1 Tax=Aestuariivirga sp. TaxID=2650926 RepID=UPI00359374C5
MFGVNGFWLLLFTPFFVLILPQASRLKSRRHLCDDAFPCAALHNGMAIREQANLLIPCQPENISFIFNNLKNNMDH